MASRSPNRQGKRPNNGLQVWSRSSPCAIAAACGATDDGFRRLIEIAPEGVTIHQNGRIVYANQAAAEQYGANDPEEILGRDGYDFIAPNDRDRIAARIKHLYEGDGQSSLTRFQRLRLNGRLADVETVAVRTLWEGRPAILSMVRDISTRLQAEERLQAFLATATDWFWETDAEHRFICLSDFKDGDPSLTQVLGKTRWELADVAPDRNELWRAHVADLEARRPFRDFEYQFTTETFLGQYRSVSGIPVFDAHGVFQGYRGTSRDITGRKQAERTIEHMALHDALTQLPNRAYFTRELERACSAAARDGTKLAVLFLDLDHFKDINDALGHSVADKLLIEVANRLEACLRGGDLVARFGGDEFVMIVPQSHDPASITSLADRIIKTIAMPCDIEGLPVHTSISIGVAIYPDDGADTERILANADIALYTAKAAGRNTWRVFDRRLQKQLLAKRSLDQALLRALDQNQFELHYQPLINIADDGIRGFEALVRWNHPTKGKVLPGVFIPATEQNRLIIPLTKWVLQEAAAQAQHWAETGLGQFKIAVNVSPLMLKLQGFADLLDRCVIAAGCDPGQLVIEITEGALIDEAKVIPVLMALRELGVTIAIDDFGTGYSSMARLKALPIDVLKIDRSFLTNVVHDAGDATIVESLVNVGHSLGKQVVAEGVETLDQLGFLGRVGCDIAQGFVINHPMAVSDVPAWFEKWQISGRCCPGQLVL